MARIARGKMQLFIGFPPCLLILFLVHVRVVQGNASGALLAAPAADDHVAQQAGQFFSRVPRVQRADQPPGVHQIVSVLSQGADRFAESGYAAPQAGNHGEVLRRQGIHPGGEKSVHRRLDRSGFGKVQASQRHKIPVRFLPVKIGFHNPPSRIRAGFVLRDFFQESVIPFEGRLRFLARDHVVRVRRQRRRHFQGAHQAGVKTDPVQFLCQRLFQRAGHFLKRQMIHIAGFVPADSFQRPAAVVPQDQGVGLGRAVFLSVAQKGDQGFLVSHICAFVRLEDPADPSAGSDLINSRAARLKIPGSFGHPGSAGHHQKRGFPARRERFGHFPDIRRGGSAGGFQVASAHINHQCQFPGVFSPDSGGMDEQKRCQ